MKQVFILFIICVLVLASETIYAQTASDYYLPLRVGNYIEYYLQGNQPGWNTRTTRYIIEGSDSISGHLYFREKGMEWPSNDLANIHVFHVFWLRKDSIGNILVGAMGASSSIDDSWSSNLDSATVYNPPGSYFSNQAIVPGYSNKYSWGDYSWEDTTMSNTETVQVPAGTFTNCVKMREIKRYTGSGAVIYLEYYYYAQGIGKVMSVREGDPPNVLVGYNAVTSVEVNKELAVPTGFSLFQNYPNPFNPTTTINYLIPKSCFVTLRIYDVLGREIETLVNDDKVTGSYDVKFDASSFTSGIYFYQLQAGSFSETKKLVLMK